MATHCRQPPRDRCQRCHRVVGWLDQVTCEFLPPCDSMYPTCTEDSSPGATDTISCPESCPLPVNPGPHPLNPAPLPVNPAPLHLLSRLVSRTAPTLHPGPVTHPRPGAPLHLRHPVPLQPYRYFSNRPVTCTEPTTDTGRSHFCDDLRLHVILLEMLQKHVTAWERSPGHSRASSLGPGPSRVV